MNRPRLEPPTPTTPSMVPIFGPFISPLATLSYRIVIGHPSGSKLQTIRDHGFSFAAS
jgi:hypothetical protein